MAVEIEVLYKLHHHNLMSLYQVYESKNSVYLVCEYIPGESLSSLLEKSKDFLTVDQIKAVTKGVLNALAHLEETGIVHRDIKPDNIMVVDSSISAESMKLCDFGLSEFISQKKPLFTNCGTPGYVAPECLEHDKDVNKNIQLRAKCDIFSLGVMAYLLTSNSILNLAGNLPFTGETSEEILRSTLEDTADFESERFEDVPLKRKV